MLPVRRCSCTLLFLLWMTSNPGHAMEALPDSMLAEVAGRDGITISLGTAPGGAVTADRVVYAADNVDPVHDVMGNLTACNSGTNENCATAIYDNLSFRRIGPNGTASTATHLGSMKLDADSDSLAVELDWERSRLRIDGISHGATYLGHQTPGNPSFGNFTLDGSGHFHLRGGKGLLSRHDATAALELNLGNVGWTGGPGNYQRLSAGDAQIYWRQGNAAGTPELSLDNVGLLYSMPEGTVGLDADGLYIAANEAIFDLTFDLKYDANGASPLAMDVNDRPILFFGWRGTWAEHVMTLGGGGSWRADGTQTEGIRASLMLDWAPDYKVIFGEAGGAGVASDLYIEFGEPVHMGPAGSYFFEVPLIALDVLNAGQGPGGLCYGLNTTTSGVNGANGCSGTLPHTALLQAQVLDIEPEDGAFAIIGRDWGIHAYAQSVRLVGTAPADNVDENWALIYTFGDNDGNIYLYPQASTPGVAGSNGGMMADVLIVTQTFGTTDSERWHRGTHFMLGDTDKNLAIGLIGMDGVFAADDMNISALSEGLQLDTDKLRLSLRGMLAGGDIPDMTRMQKIAYIDFNLESDNALFRLEPAPIGQSYMGYYGFFSLADLDEPNFSNDTGGAHGHDDGTYFSLSEPGFDRLNVDFRLARITGDIEFRNGRLDIQSSTETANGRPAMVLAHDLHIGRAATVPGSGVPGDILEIGAVEFGGQSLGRIVIPEAVISASLTLKQQ